MLNNVGGAAFPEPDQEILVAIRPDFKVCRMEDAGVKPVVVGEIHFLRIKLLMYIQSQEWLVKPATAITEALIGFLHTLVNSNICLSRTR